MPKPRPALLLAAAVTAALATWAADPGWARAAGLDAWNYGREEGALRAARAADDRLDRERAASAYRWAANVELVRAVETGRRPLAEVAADSLRLNVGTPGFLANLDFYHPAPTREAQAALNLIRRVGLWSDLAGPEKDRMLARLRAEYATAFPPQAGAGGAPTAAAE
jgi:hypothetical protein